MNHQSLLLLTNAVPQVRKAKLIASYELAIKVNWEGTTADGQPGSGIIELPYVADENHDEVPEIKIILPKDDKPSQQLKAEILSAGKQVGRLDPLAGQHGTAGFTRGHGSAV